MAPPTALAPSLDEEVDPPVAEFYRQALQALNDANVPFLIGGAFAHACHTGIRRPTKDLDLFILRADYERIARTMQQHGWRCELSYTMRHFLSPR